MGLENLETVLDSMADDAIIPTPPPAPPDNTWEPGDAAIRVIVGLMKQGVEAGWSRNDIFEEIIQRAQDQYSRVIYKPQLRRIWEAWQREIAERLNP